MAWTSADTNAERASREIAVEMSALERLDYEISNLQFRLVKFTHHRAEYPDVVAHLEGKLSELQRQRATLTDQEAA